MNKMKPGQIVLFNGIRREQERGDRAGGAAIFHPLVHAHGVYDLEVDTSLQSAQECAAQVKTAILNQMPCRAFSQLQWNLRK